MVTTILQIGHAVGYSYRNVICVVIAYWCPSIGTPVVSVRAVPSIVVAVVPVTVAVPSVVVAIVSVIVVPLIVLVLSQLTALVPLVFPESPAIAVEVAFFPLMVLEFVLLIMLVAMHRTPVVVAISECPLRIERASAQQPDRDD
jgi:hypothetical protein